MLLYSNVFRRLNNYFDPSSLEHLFLSGLSLYTCKVIRLFIIVNADGTLRNRVSWRKH